MAACHSPKSDSLLAKNKIQFQEGLSLPRLLATYGTEEQSLEALFNRRWPQGLRCPKCGLGHCVVDRLLHAALRTQPVPQRLLKLAEVRW
ncbi:MAG: IS1595 family transposase [Bacteroidia bacterium]|nr:IS1595 family transposase [Bacteroidia bacterium]